MRHCCVAAACLTLDVSLATNLQAILPQDAVPASAANGPATTQPAAEALEEFIPLGPPPGQRPGGAPAGASALAAPAVEGTELLRRVPWLRSLKGIRSPLLRLHQGARVPPRGQAAELQASMPCVQPKPSHLAPYGCRRQRCRTSLVSTRRGPCTAAL